MTDKNNNDTTEIILDSIADGEVAEHPREFGLATPLGHHGQHNVRQGMTTTNAHRPAVETLVAGRVFAHDNGDLACRAKVAVNGFSPGGLDYSLSLSPFSRPRAVRLWAS